MAAASPVTNKVLHRDLFEKGMKAARLSFILVKLLQKNEAYLDGSNVFFKESYANLKVFDRTKLEKEFLMRFFFISEEILKERVRSIYPALLPNFS